MAGADRAAPVRGLHAWLRSFRNRWLRWSDPEDDPGHDVAALEARIRSDLQAIRAEATMRIDALREELHAFIGSLHADCLRQLSSLRATVDTDLACLLRIRQSPEADVESLLTDTMRHVVEKAIEEIRNDILDRSDLTTRVMEQELVRITTQLKSRLAALESRPAGADPASADPAVADPADDAVRRGAEPASSAE